MTLTLCLIPKHAILTGHPRIFHGITDTAANYLTQTVFSAVLGFPTSQLTHLGNEMCYSFILSSSDFQFNFHPCVPFGHPV